MTSLSREVMPMQLSRRTIVTMIVLVAALGAVLSANFFAAGCAPASELKHTRVDSPQSGSWSQWGSRADASCGSWKEVARRLADGTWLAITPREAGWSSSCAAYDNSSLCIFDGGSQETTIPGDSCEDAWRNDHEGPITLDEVVRRGLREVAVDGDMFEDQTGHWHTLARLTISYGHPLSDSILFARGDVLNIGPFALAGDVEVTRSGERFAAAACFYVVDFSPHDCIYFGAKTP